MHFIRIVILFLATWLLMSQAHSQMRLKEVRLKYEQKAIPHFTYYFQKNSLADSAQPFIDSTLQQYRNDILMLMGEQDYVPRMEMFFFSTPADFANAVNSKAQGISFASDNIACYIFSRSFQGYSRHELAHIMSINLWGHSALWMEEGFAALADESFQEQDFHAQAKGLLAVGNFIAAKSLIKYFNRYEGEWRRYVEAASLLSFIRTQYGIKTLQSCWKAKTVAQPGMSEEQVLEAWMAFLKK